MQFPSNPNQNREVELLASSTATWIPALAVISMRFICRYKSRAEFWLDDWLALAGFLVATLLWVLTLYIIKDYTSHHLGDVDISRIEAFGKTNFVCEIGYGWCLAFVKLSILALYWRLFKSVARWPILIMSGFVSLWAITWFFFLLFQCHPVSGAWDVLSPDRKCFNMKDLWVYGPLPHIIEDVILLAIPIPYILKLNLRLEQRLSLCSVFLLGFFVTFVSILRVVFVSKVDIDNIDFTWTFTNVTIWSGVEINCAVICACLPCLRPIIQFARTGSFQSHSSFSTLSGAATGDREHGKRLSAGPARWNGKAIRHTAPGAADSFPDSTGSSANNIPLEKIVVTTDWKVDRV